MIFPYPNLDKIITNKVLGSLHEICVKPSELSSKAVQNQFAQSKEVKESKSKYSLTKFKTLAKKRAPPGVKEKKPVTRNGKGFKQKTSTFPGTRPNIFL